MPSKRKKRIYILLFIAFALILSINFLPNKSIEDRIKEGSLSYTQTLGWVNWGHAKKERTQKAFLRFIMANKNADSNFTFNYAQKMRYDVLGIGVYAIQKESFIITKTNDSLTLIQNFYSIFKEVSNSFEKMQGSFPHNVFSGIANSSFRDGDLMGNYISFYLTVNNLDIEAIKKKYKSTNKNESINQFELKGVNKRKWDAVNTSPFKMSFEHTDTSLAPNKTSSTMSYSF